MPKSPFKRKHVKFEDVVYDSASQSADEDCNNQTTSADKTSSNTSHQQETIEVHIYDDKSSHPDHVTGRHCTSCHILGQSEQHQSVTSETDQSDDTGLLPCCPKQGPHVVILTILCAPFVFVLAFIVTGYLGVLTWYNIFLYYYDERGWLHRILVCPVLVLLFPPIILTAALSISVYSSLGQISWKMKSWRTSVTDLEKGFYAWLCVRIGLHECSPYEVITLDDDDDDLYGTPDLSPHADSPV